MGAKFVKDVMRTVERDCFNYPRWKNDPLLENVRGEPRFQELMAVVKEKWENFGD